MNCFYSVFGLLVRSNVVLPGVPQAYASGPAIDDLSELTADLQLHLGVSPPTREIALPLREDPIYVSAYLDDSGNPVLRIWQAGDESFLRLDYSDGTRFWLDRARENLWATWPENSSLQNTLTYVLGPVFGLILRLRGVVCLHASAVAFGLRRNDFMEGCG